MSKPGEFVYTYAMATTYPDGWKELAFSGAKQREIETLTLLDEGLPASYRVYHGVHWTRLQKNSSIHGEIDFAILAPNGKLLLIEQKSGFLTETPEGLAKTYKDTTKSVPIQMARSLDSLKNRLSSWLKGEHMEVEYLLYCPDYQVKDPGSAGIAPERIVDARRRDQLLAIVRGLLPEDAGDTALAGNIHRFMSDTLNLVPDVNAFVGESRQLYTRLSGGLAQWARCLDFAPFRLRVQGTAGSGKTQLALAQLRESSSLGRRAMYVCYNRPLADHIALIAPKEVEVATYHQLADRLVRASGKAPDFSTPNAFAQLEAYVQSYVPDANLQVDDLVIDEGQDFKPEWREALMRFVRNDGRVWWLEDPMQNLYNRPPQDFSGWVTLRADINYRSPHDILDTLARLVPLEHAVEAGSPLTGSEVEILTYANTPGLIEQTKLGIRNCIAAGYKRENIAVVTYRGREHSLLTPYDRLGDYKLRAFTGKYDLLGSPLMSEGDIVIDSVYRFKGQSAPCVVFTEIDFENLDTLATRKIFVGATRAGMKLVLVVSEKAAENLLDRLNS